MKTWMRGGDGRVRVSGVVFYIGFDWVMSEISDIAPVEAGKM